VRILLDHGTPAPLRRALTGHSVATAYEKGWATLTNGELLTVAEDAFDVFVTTDRSRRRRDLRRNGSCASIVSTGCPASAYTWATSNDQK